MQLKNLIIALTFLFTLPALAQTEIILDNTDTQGVTITGSWPTSASVTGYYGANYIHDQNSGKGSKSVRYTPTFSAPGSYEVYIRYASSSNRASNVPVDITHANGTNQLLVNQRTGGGQWILLGTFDFAAGSNGNVLISTTGTNGYVIADAIRWVRVGDAGGGGGGGGNPPPGEIILDNLNAEAVFSGPWSTNSGNGTYGSNFRHDNNANKGLCTATYTPNLQAGYYAVYGWWNDNWNGNDLRVPIAIHHADGVANLQLSQRTGSQWVFLGTYRFNAGTNSPLVVSNSGTTMRVVADAFRWTPVAEPATARNNILFGPQSDAFDTMRNKRIEMLLGPEDYDLSDPDVYNSKILPVTIRAQQWWDTMNKSANRTFLWKDTTGNDASHTYSMVSRLKEMALAYCYSPTKNGLNLWNNPALRADIISALEWVHVNRFNSSTPYDAGFWFHYNIGIPRELGDLIAVMYPHIPATLLNSLNDAIQTFLPENFSYAPSGNNAWACRAKIMQGVNIKDAAKIDNGRNRLMKNFNLTSRSEGGQNGMYSDGSYIDHGYFAYGTGYGIDYVQETAEVVELLNGSTWEIASSVIAPFLEFTLLAYAPYVFDGDTFFYLHGRGLADPGAQNHRVTYRIIRAYAQLAEIAPPAMRSEFQSLIKRWVNRTGYAGFYSGAGTVRSIKSVKSIVADTSIPEAPQEIGNYLAHNMDRVAHRRNNWAFGISMSSSRVGRWECVYGLNRKGWYQGEGMTYLLDSDYTRYHEDFWPTVDSQRLPGTTVDTLARTPANNNPAEGENTTTQDWVGGVYTPNGLYGAAGMSVDSSVGSLVAKKSWFMFDDEVVALGAGITASDGRAIETIIDNQKLNSAGNNSLLVNGNAQSTALGWNQTLSNINRVHYTGNLGSQIGYFFPQPVTLHALREARAGKWSDIYSSAGASTITRNYLTMILNHGINPTDQTYAYAILPGFSSAQVNTYASSPHFTILENSAEAQGVRENNLKVTAVNYWLDQQKTVGGITSNRQSSVILHDTGANWEFGVSDPTQKNQGKILVSLNQNAYNVLSQDSAITVLSVAPIRFWVDTLQADGRPYHVRFNKSDDGRGPWPYPAGRFYFSEHFNSIWKLTTTSGAKPWVNDSTLPQWYGWIGVGSDLAAGGPSTQINGSTNTGTLHSSGGNGSVDRAFGAANWQNIAAYGVRLVNDTSVTHHTLYVRYFSEEYQQGATKTVLFSFSKDATTLANGTWTEVPALNIVPIHQSGSAYIDGNLPENQRLVQGSITIPGGLDPGQALWMRWVSPRLQGGRVGIDNLEVSSTPFSSEGGGSGGNSSVDLILDNSDASGITITGTWPTSTFVSGYYGTNYIHDQNSGKGSKSVRYTPNLPAAGSYEVFIRYVADTSRANNVPVDITHSGGTSTVTVNQRINGGTWVSLGTYNFAAGTGGNVLIRTTGTNGYVIADAVRFSKP